MDQFDDIFLEFVLNRIPREKWRAIWSGYDILRRIEDDDQEEIKNEIYDLVLQRIRWSVIIQYLHQQLVQDDEEEEEEEEED